MKKGEPLCKKLSRDATKEEREIAHKVEMAKRKLIREHNNQKYGQGPYILANISKNHEHYGDTPQEHERRKNSS